VYTKDKEFQLANKERKIELIQIDAYNLLIKYLRGDINYSEIQNKIIELAKFGYLDKTQLTDFLKDKIIYEEYQCSIGKKEGEKNQIRKRFIKFKENS